MLRFFLVRDAPRLSPHRYHLLVEGYGLAAVMGAPGIDGTRTRSNHIIEVSDGRRCCYLIRHRSVATAVMRCPSFCPGTSGGISCSCLAVWLLNIFLDFPLGGLRRCFCSVTGAPAAPCFLGLTVRREDMLELFIRQLTWWALRLRFFFLYIHRCSKRWGWRRLGSSSRKRSHTS